MIPITYDQALLEIETQKQHFERVIGNIAAAVHRDFVAPFCKKHNLRFVQNMGAYGFYTLDSDTEFTLRWQTDNEAPEGFLDMERMLHIEVTPTTYLYQYIPTEGQGGLND